jgi:tetratricopeptide (TPR) repeat protein/TolB-like protein
VAFALQAMGDARDTGSVDAVRETVILDRRRRRVRRAATAVAAVAAVVVSVVGFRLLRAPPPVLPDELQIAVIDFTAPDAGSLSDHLVATPVELAAGLTEVVSRNLSLLERQTHGAMWVLPRRHRAPETPWTLETVSKLHGVTLGLEGHVRTDDGRLVLDLSLRAPGSDSPLRTAVIEDQLDNLVSFQESTLTTISEMLDVEPEESILEDLRESSTFVVSAFASYLSGVGRLVRSKDFPAAQDAHDLLARAAELDPTYAPFHESLLRSCALLIERGDEANLTPSCDDHLFKAERQSNAGVIAAIAAVHRATGDNARAAQLMEEAIAIRPDDAELQLQLGKDRLRLKELDVAENTFHRAVDLRPGFWEGYYYLGFVDYVRGNYEATANAWRVASRCAPERAKIYSNLGAVFHALDRRDEARRMLEMAVELSGFSDYVTLSNLGTLYFEDAQFAEAAATFEKALAISDGDYRIWGHLAWSYASSFDAAKAVEPFERAVALAETELENTPDDPSLLARLAGYYGMVGRRDRATETVERAVSLDPQDPIVIATIGETLEDLGDRERALEWIGRAMSLGVPRSHFESHPSLRDLVADERYQSLIQDPGSLVSPEVS